MTGSIVFDPLIPWTVLALLAAMTTAAVAAELGYESEASFARAFKRVTSQSPGMVRRSNSGRTAIEVGL